MDKAQFAVSVARADGEIIIVIAGELDKSTAGQLTDAVAAELAHAPGRLVLGLDALTFCDSLGLATSLTLNRTSCSHQAHFVIRNPSPFFARMLDVTGVRAGLNVED